MSKNPAAPGQVNPSDQEREEAGQSGPPRRQLGELVFAVILLVASLWVLYQSYRISGLGGYVSPGALPLATSLVLVGTMIVIVVTTFRKSAPEVADSENILAVLRKKIIPPMLPITIMAIVVYALALEPLGFFFSSVLFLCVLVSILQGGRIVRAIVVSILSVVIIHTIFRYGFEVLLPTGYLL